MRLFEVGETIETGWKLHRKLGRDKEQLFLPVGSPGPTRYLRLPVGKSLWEGNPEMVTEAELTRVGTHGYCLTKQQKVEDTALVRVCVSSTPDIPVRYEFSSGVLVIMGGVFGTDPPVPMYLIEMARGSSFRWQRGHDGVVYQWDGETLHERRGTELPS